LLDRFDLRVPIGRPEPDALLGAKPSAPSAASAERILAARDRAVMRGVSANAHLTPPQLDQFAPVSRAAASILDYRLRQGSLSARGLHRVRRVALTLADLDGVEGELADRHICAALELRSELASLEVAS
jgi:magnesium chelatase family protein